MYRMNSIMLSTLMDEFVLWIPLYGLCMWTYIMDSVVWFMHVDILWFYSACDGSVIGSLNENFLEIFVWLSIWYRVFLGGRENQFSSASKADEIKYSAAVFWPQGSIFVGRHGRRN